MKSKKQFTVIAALSQQIGNSAQALCNAFIADFVAQAKPDGTGRLLASGKEGLAGPKFNAPPPRRCQEAVGPPDSGSFSQRWNPLGSA